MTSQPNDATVRVPTLIGSGADVKDQIYRLRGEAMSVAGHVEWIISGLTKEFVPSFTKREAKRRWNEALKPYLGAAALTQSLQPQLADMAAYFGPRNLTSHAAFIISNVGTENQIIRLWESLSGLEAQTVSFDDLKGEVDTIRKAWTAIRTIGGAMHHHDPKVLKNEFSRMLMLGV